MCHATHFFLSRPLLSPLLNDEREPADFFKSENTKIAPSSVAAEKTDQRNGNGMRRGENERRREKETKLLQRILQGIKDRTASALLNLSRLTALRRRCRSLSCSKPAVFPCFVGAPRQQHGALFTVSSSSSVKHRCVSACGPSAVTVLRDPFLFSVKSFSPLFRIANIFFLLYCRHRNLFHALELGPVVPADSGKRNAVALQIERRNF